MRNHFIAQLCKEAEKNEKIWLLTGDLGYSALEPFIEKFPDRFINVGVSEQNMIGVAAGLALSGMKVFTYSIANFSFMRCLEQIRVDVCYHNLDVNIVAVGAGFAYGGLGYTHFGIEDIGMLRTLEKITLYSPADPLETIQSTHAMCYSSGPKYIRLGRASGDLHEDTNIDISSPVKIGESGDITIISTGSIALECKEAINKIQKEDKEARISLWSVPKLNHTDFSNLLKDCAHSKNIIVVEEHASGGLSSILSEELLNHNISINTFKTIKVQKICQFSGNQDYQREQSGVSLSEIYNAIKIVRKK
jgi:transketolase